MATINNGRAYWDSTGAGYVLAVHGTIYGIRILNRMRNHELSQCNAFCIRDEAWSVESLGGYDSRQEAANACLKDANVKAANTFAAHDCAECGQAHDEQVRHHGRMLCRNCLPPTTAGQPAGG